MSTEKSNNELAEERTEKAEDRTLLANERTFAGWARTSMASIGLGLGFQALFKEVEPTWVAKTIATLFVLLGVWIAWKAEQRARRLLGEQEAHEVRNTSGREFRVLAVAITAGAGILLLCLWWLL